MTTPKFAFVGLTRWSAALARGLAGRSDARRVIYADEVEQARAAHKDGVFTASDWNLISAIEGAQAVIVSGPVPRQVELLKALCPELAPEASVVALTPVFAPLLTLALPVGRGLALAHPLLAPTAPDEATPDWQTATAEDFGRGAWLLAAAPGAETALALAADLARAVGAQAHFMDPVEHDAASAGAVAAPQVLAAALLAVASRPGWTELQRAADRGFATATRAADGAQTGDWIANRAALTEALDALTTEISRLRAAIQVGDDPTLTNALSAAQQQRAAWLRARAAGEWDPSDHTRAQVPTLGESLGRMLFGGLGRKKR